MASPLDLQTEAARRFDYALTAKSKELFPLLMTLLAWGDKWSPGDKGPLVKLRHAGCGKLTRAGLVCTQCSEALHPDNLRTRFAPAYKELTHAH